jgi:hypothetical protein
VVVHDDPARSMHEVSLLLHVTPSFLRMSHLCLSDAASSLLSLFHVRSRAQTHTHVYMQGMCVVCTVKIMTESFPRCPLCRSPILAILRNR